MNPSGTYPATFLRLGGLIKAYEAGLDCYQRRDWKSGLNRFGEALELTLHDRPSRIIFLAAAVIIRHTRRKKPGTGSGSWSRNR
jgi:hypothetical protein